MKKTAFISILAVLLCTLPSLLPAQRQYLSATVTTNDGQKIAGKIAPENWRLTPRSIEFQSAEGRQQTYRIVDIAAFEATRHDGQILMFERRVVDIEVSPHRLEELDMTPALNFKKDTAWLQVVYQGACTLYELSDLNGKPHFFIETNELPAVELACKVWSSTENGTVLLKRIDLFKKQLHDIMQGCPAAQAMVTDINLGTRIGIGDAKKAIVKICEAYSKCQNITSNYKMKPERGTISGILLAGTHRSTVNMTPYLDQPINGLNGFHIGFALDYFFWKSNRRVSLQNQILAYHEKNLSSILVGKTVVYKSEIDYESWQVLFANMCALRVTKSGLAPTLKLGLAHRITLGHKVNWKYGSPSHFETVKIRDYSFAKKVYEIGPVVGLSIEFHRIGLALDYCITNNWSKLTLGEQADTKMLALHASYRLF